MKKVTTTDPKLTRGDKAHIKFMDKLEVFNNGLTRSLNSFTLIHKQTLDAFGEIVEKVSKSQELERSALCEIIKSCENETRRREAYGRLAELDRIKEEEINKYIASIQNERDIANKNIIVGLLLLAVAGGFISSKQERQMTGKAFNTMNKKLLHTKK